MSGKKLTLMESLRRKQAANSHRQRSNLAGITFPVGMVHRFLKAKAPIPARVTAFAAVYTAAVLELITTQTLNAAVNLDEDRITPRTLRLAVAKNKDLKSLLKRLLKGENEESCIHSLLLFDDEMPSLGADPVSPMSTSDEESEQEATSSRV